MKGFFILRLCLTDVTDAHGLWTLSVEICVICEKLNRQNFTQAWLGNYNPQVVNLQDLKIWSYGSRNSFLQFFEIFALA